MILKAVYFSPLENSVGRCPQCIFASDCLLVFMLFESMWCSSLSRLFCFPRMHACYAFTGIFYLNEGTVKVFVVLSDQAQINVRKGYNSPIFLNCTASVSFIVYIFINAIIHSVSFKSFILILYNIVSYSAFVDRTKFKTMFPFEKKKSPGDLWWLVCPLTKYHWYPNTSKLHTCWNWQPRIKHPS